MKDIVLNPGEVWDVKFPFDENDGRFKTRPGIIIEKLGKAYMVIKCTSKDKTRDTAYDYILKNPTSAKLVSSGRVRCNKVGLIQDSKEKNFINKRGKLDDEDFNNILNKYEMAKRKGKLNVGLKSLVGNRASVEEEHVHFIKEETYNLIKSIDVDNPEELNKYLNNFGYDNNISANPKSYRSLSPKKFLKLRKGICWDFAEFEAEYFKEVFANYSFTIQELKNDKYSLYFYQQEDGKSNATHTWLAYMDNDTVYVIESSWGEMMGIHKYTSEDEMINDYVSKLNPDGNKAILKKYYPFKRYNLTAKEYLDIIYGTGNFIINDFSDSIEEFFSNGEDNEPICESSQNIDEFGGPGGMVGAVDLSYVTQYGYKGSESDEVEGYALSNDILTKNILIVDNKTMKVKKESSSFLDGRKISIYKYTGENSMLPILNSIGKRAYREYFYEALTGKTLLSDDQILVDGVFSLFSPPALHEEMVSYVQTIVDECHYLMGKPVYKFPIANETELEEVSELLKGDKTIAVFENLNGYFAENIYSKKRTGYYKHIKDIQIGAIKC